MHTVNDRPHGVVNSVPAIATRNLVLGYGAERVVDDLSLEFPAGAVTAVIGPNGCGKSTLLKSLTRIVNVASGNIEVEGQALEKYSAKALARKIAFLPQVLPVPDGITVRQLVAYGRSPHNDIWGRLGVDDAIIIDAAMQQLEVFDLGNRLVADLSGGQRQRVWIAMIVAQQTPIVLLDEPTTFLDISHQVELLKLARRMASQGKTVITVLHDLNQAFRYSDHVAIMKDGKLIISGKPAELASPDLLRRVFSIDCSVISDPESLAPMVVIKD